jgi:hypothetical protein
MKLTGLRVLLLALPFALAACAPVLGVVGGPTESVVLPNGEICGHAGGGATLAFDGQRLAWTCDVAETGPRGPVREPGRGAGDRRLVATRHGGAPRRRRRLRARPDRHGGRARRAPRARVRRDVRLRRRGGDAGVRRAPRPLHLRRRRRPGRRPRGRRPRPAGAARGHDPPRRRPSNWGARAWCASGRSSWSPWTPARGRARRGDDHRARRSREPGPRRRSRPSRGGRRPRPCWDGLVARAHPLRQRHRAHAPRARPRTRCCWVPTAASRCGWTATRAPAGSRSTRSGSSSRPSPRPAPPARPARSIRTSWSSWDRRRRTSSRDDRLTVITTEATQLHFVPLR